MTQEQPQYKGIVARLRGIQAKISRLEAFRGAIQVLGLLFLLAILLVGISMITWPNQAIRIFSDIFIAIILLLAIYFWVIRPYLNRPGFLEIARSLEQKYGKFQSRLIGALELHDLAVKNRENYSLELIDKTIEEAGGVIADVDADAVINYKAATKSLTQIGVLFVAMILVILVSPGSVYQTWLLYSQPLSNFEKPAQFTLSLKPAGGEFYRNMDLMVEAKSLGKTPRHVDLYYRFEDGDWANETMAEPDTVATAAFTYTFKKVKRSLDIYARSGKVLTPKAHIEIVDPPRLTDLRLRLEYPEYSGLASAQSNPNDGNVSALRGTKVYIDATANKPLGDCYQMYSDSSISNLEINGDKISGSFSVKDNSRYTLIFHDKSSRQNPEPIWYDIQALDDYPPTIDIKFPGVDVDLEEHMLLPLKLTIADDYGFGKLNLVWWIQSGDQEGEPKKEALTISDKKSLDQEIDYRWDIQPLNPVPGDLIYYYAEVSDNDIVTGPKWAKTRTFSARLPNLDEILADVQGSQDKQMEGLDEALKNQKDLQKQVEQLAKDMRSAKDVNWEKQQEAKKAIEKQQEIAKSLEKLANDMQDNLQKLEDNKLIGEQIAEKMQQIQDLLEQVAPPELKEAMKKLQEALEKMDPNLLKKALEQFQVSSKQLLENLDRALALLQKMAIEQKMDMMAELAQKILDQQNKINENVEKAQSDSSALANQSQPQQNNSDEFNSLKDQFNQLMKMDQKEQMIPPDQKDNANKEVNNPEIPPNFQDMKSSLSMGSGQCKAKGKKLSKNLQDMANALADARKSMQDQQKMEISKKLQKAAEDLLYLSGRQENLLDSTRAIEGTGDGIRQMAGSQMQIAGASTRIAENVSELSKETIFINMMLMQLLGRTLADMSDATNHLDKRLPDAAVNSEQSAMSNLNKTVYLLLQAKKNAMNSSSGSGMEQMMKQMSKMCQSQGQINGQTMSLMPKPGSQLTMQQSQALQQLAGQQEMLRQQMQEMSDQMGKQGNMLGRLDQLGEEMKKVVDDLSKSNVNQQTIERQEQILSRMLDAQKSVNRREYSKKRQSEQGEDIVRKSPMMPDEQILDENSLSSMIKKALEEQYPRQYEKLIRAYFKSVLNEGAAVDDQK